LSVRLDKESGNAVLYPEELFVEVTQINLISPVYWALEMVARIAEDRHRRAIGRWDPRNEKLQGTAIFIGSVSSQGNKGQIAYAATKRGLEGAAATMMKESMYYGVKCAVIHPGFTDTPMVQALGQEYIDKNILPVHAASPAHSPGGNRQCDLLHDPELRRQRGTVGGRGWHPTA
jgi:NAD(P)-dependent dehydrogenase (short-subunit alcohol dehydrogenase family)